MNLPSRTLVVLFFALYFSTIGFAQNNQQELTNNYPSPSTALIELNKRYEKVYSLNEKSECILYGNLGTVHFQLNNTDSALYYLNHSLNIASKSGFVLIEIEVLEKMGEIFRHQGNFKEATDYYSKAVLKGKDLENPTSHTNSGLNLYFQSGVIALLAFIIIYLFYRNSKSKKIIQAQQKNDLSKPALLGEFLVSIKKLNNQLRFALSQREYEVLCLVVKGQTSAQIAEKLFISVNTIKTHLTNIFEKLEVANRKEAIEKVISIKSDKQQ